MNSLKIPDGGVLLAASESKPSIPQAFHLRLDTALIESIIHASQNGDDLRLALGKTPTLQYGSKSHRISPPTDSADFDLYLTKPFESTREAVRIASTTSLFSKPRQAKKAAPPVTEKENGADHKSKSSLSQRGGYASSGLDSDLEVVNGSSAAARGMARDRARVGGSKLLDSKRASAQQSRPPKPISEYGSKASPLPASPGLNPVPSPSLGPTLSASQQAMERAREQRVTLVHELAVQDCSLDSLRGKWVGKDAEFRPTLEKVAEYSSTADKWTLRKMYFKELDPWKYAYQTKEERQKAIDNAVRQFDKQRLSAQEPEWQKLLPKEERNKGKCLSRLQANLAKGPAQNSPAVKNGKGEDGGAMSGDGVESDRPKAGGETMARSGSNSVTSKPKKASAQEAQAKRLLSAAKSKPAIPKTSPRKTKAVVAKANGRPALSKEIVENSDTSEDEASAAVKPHPPAKPKPPAATTKTKDTATATTTTAAAAAAATRRAPAGKTPAAVSPAKRPLEDDDSSSSSGMPLSKRNKQKPPPPAQKAAVHRASDASAASASSRGTAGPPSSKPKNTSPTKSSPLASSPPTNASDLESEAPTRPAAPVKKRKLHVEPEAKPPSKAMKKRNTDVSVDILNKASKFKQFYQQYEALHYEILALDNPPDEKLANLLDLRGRLETMKREIYKDCSPA